MGIRLISERYHPNITHQLEHTYHFDLLEEGLDFHDRLTAYGMKVFPKRANIELLEVLYLRTLIRDSRDLVYLKLAAE